MAIVNVHPIRNGLEGSLIYVKNRRKTQNEDRSLPDSLPAALAYIENPTKVNFEKEYFVTGINCNPSNAYQEFVQVQKQFGKFGEGIAGHFGYQSFHKDEKITAGEVHAIGVKLAERFFSERFQVVVTTHVDKEHLHNHFIINSVSFVDGKKYLGKKATLKELRMLSDELCKEHELSVIKKPRYYGKDRSAYYAEKRAAEGSRPVWRDLVRDDVDDAIRKSVDMKGFYNEMTKRGYIIKPGKHIAVSPPDFYKNDHRAFIRLRSIGDDYTEDAITNRVRENSVINYGIIKPEKIIRKRCKVSRKRKLPAYMAVYYKYMFRLGLMKKKPKRMPAYMIRKQQLEASDLSEQIRYIHNNKLQNEDTLISRRDGISNEIRNLELQRKKLRNEMYRYNASNEDEIEKINKELKELRRELRICNRIGVTAPVLPEMMRDTTSSPKNGKEKENERRIRSSRNNGEVDRTGD